MTLAKSQGFSYSKGKEVVFASLATRDVGEEMCILSQTISTRKKHSVTQTMNALHLLILGVEGHF